MVAEIRAKLRKLNRGLSNAAVTAADASGSGGGSHAVVAVPNSASLCAEKDAAKMVSDIEFRTDYRFEEERKSGAYSLTANALSGEAVVLFWRGFNLERKAGYVREFVDCEYVERSDEHREEIYRALHKKLRKGFLDSRVLWNGYHIDKIQGLVVELVEEENPKTGAVQKVLSIVFQQPGSGGSNAPAAAGSAATRAQRGVGCGAAASVHNLRMQIERQKTEHQMRLDGELDDEPEYTSTWSKRRW